MEIETHTHFERLLSTLAKRGELASDKTAKLRASNCTQLFKQICATEISRAVNELNDYLAKWGLSCRVDGWANSPSVIIRVGPANNICVFDARLIIRCEPNQGIVRIERIQCESRRGKRMAHEASIETVDVNLIHCQLLELLRSEFAF